MSVDPFIQSPTSTQSVNPYSYIMNNPLSGTDPTGYACTTAQSMNGNCGSGGASSESIGDKEFESIETYKDKAIVNTKDGASYQLTSVTSGQKNLQSATSATIDDVGKPSDSSKSDFGSGIKSFLKTVVNSFKKGGFIGAALTPSTLGNGELSEETHAMMREKIKENRIALAKMITAAKERGENHITLFRTASPIESQDIRNTRVFRMGPLLFPKQLTLNIEDARAMALNLPIDDRPFSIFAARISLQTAMQMMPNTDPQRGYRTIFYLTAYPKVLERVNNDVKRNGGAWEVE